MHVGRHRRQEPVVGTGVDSVQGDLQGDSHDTAPAVRVGSTVTVTFDAFTISSPTPSLPS